MKHFAFADRTGVIEFGPFVPKGRLAIASSEDQGQLQDAIGGIARVAYDNKTLLVPGVPEADSDEEAVGAMIEFTRRALDALRRQAN